MREDAASRTSSRVLSGVCMADFLKKPRFASPATWKKTTELVTREGKQRYTLRVTIGARAIPTVEGDTLVLLFLEPNQSA